MIGLIGFILAALSIGAFGASVNGAFPAASPSARYHFSLALYLLAAAMVLWGVTVAVNDPSVTDMLFIATDILMATATLVLIRTVFYGGRLVITVLATFVAVLVAYRATTVPTTAFIEDGLLHFNLQDGLRTTLLGTLLLVWLPIMLTLARRFGAVSRFEWVTPVLTLQYSLLVFATAMFMSARRPWVIVSLFGMMIVLFVVATVFNRSLSQIPAAVPQKKGKKHHATGSAS
ncbi:MAG: hypothetical protein JWM37_586 [Candidatus Saccharibacteria bacterium]|nr:hypothetical protein [Candidatus Saccharibacteria bacterium]